MKTERRHELKENDLAHLLEQGWQYANANAKRLSLIIIGGLALILLASVAMRSRAASVEDTWRRRAELKFDTIDNVRTALPTLKELRAGASDDAFVLNSLIEQGTIALRFARQAPGGRADKDLNEQARAAFDELLSRFSANPLALGVAHLGLASVAENAFTLDGNLAHRETAAKHLDQVINNSALNTTPFNRLALDRRSSLDSIFRKIEFAPSLDADPEDMSGANP